MDTAFHIPALDSRADSLRMAKPQKAFAVAFAVLTAALAGCASGLGASTHESAAVGSVAHVEEGTVVALSSVARPAPSQSAFAYTIRLPSGELVSVGQAGDYAIPSGTPVLIEYGAQARVIPQRLT